MNLSRIMLPLAVLLALVACGAEPSAPPSSPPTDPCNGVCGRGTICDRGVCVLVDAGLVAVDAPPPLDLGAAPVDASPSRDAPPVDVLDAVAVDVLEDRAEVAPAPDVLDVLDAGHPADVPTPPPDVCVCSYPNARAECSPSGACSLVGCLPGFADCDGRNVNGCETNTNEAANCGACDNRCPAGVRCINGRCDTCAPSEQWCAIVGSGMCTPPDDARNCGTCGNACAATTRCVMGRCVNPCPSGLTYCQPNIEPSVACVDVRVGRRDRASGSTLHCGDCNHTCVAPLSGCVNGMCVR